MDSKKLPITLYLYNQPISERISNLLESYNELFEKYSYRLLCCNASSGTNAFFIKNKYIDLFPEILDNISDIYVEQGVRFKSVGGETSPKTVKNFT